jgi:hypothetical protein
MVSVIRLTFRTSEAIAADLAGDAAVAFLFPFPSFCLLAKVTITTLERLLLPVVVLDFRYDCYSQQKHSRNHASIDHKVTEHYSTSMRLGSPPLTGS